MKRWDTDRIRPGVEATAITVGQITPTVGRGSLPMVEFMETPYQTILLLRSCRHSAFLRVFIQLMSKQSASACAAHAQEMPRRSHAHDWVTLIPSPP